ncbi:MAG: hypothetical protein C4B59_07475 [Candidatus Methanogaster sp.]|uniref:Uncharacterized protein n=1 Tax=Candidatus Methanogaster sp. TaxID=3386292 RepID=A0AC61L310_9EURY|nr:MAG: hypothetical protein C4B59_07475 [ANME-2 cluster archaeon]
MNAKILDEWADIIGYERTKTVADLFLDRKMDLDFPDLGQGDLTYVKRSIITELEDTGTILMELDGSVLNHGEIITMVDVLARDLISKTLHEAFVNNISEMLPPDEERLEKELDCEIKYIKEVLNSIQQHGKDLE